MDDAHPFAQLAGTWRGTGKGFYPSIEPFAYTEELVVEPVPGRPLAHWRSRTRDAGTGEPRHAESGFLRTTPAGIEFVVAHGFGLVETASGSFDGGALVLGSQAIVGTASAKSVEQVERRYELSQDSDSDGGPDALQYWISMAAVSLPLTAHLEATLHRVPADQ